MEPFIYLVLLVFIGLVFLVFGNLMSKNIYNPLIYILFWIIYTITVLTLVNSGINLYTYLVINKKQVQPGERGPPGPDGDAGETGECENNCRIKQYIKKIMKDLELKYNSILTQARGKEESPQRKINNKFIKDTITRICTSNQFKEIAQSRNIDDLIKYLTEVFKKWFDILAKADKSNKKKNLQNYMEVYGETVEWEFVTNPVNNPFGEIEKYDIYYWGLNKDFRPILVSSCNKKSEVEKNKNHIKAIKTNLYKKIYSSTNTGVKLDLNLWLSQPITINDEKFLPLGNIASSKEEKVQRYTQSFNGVGDTQKQEVGSNTNGPSKSNILVSTKNRDLVRTPPSTAWEWKWDSYVTDLNRKLYSIDYSKTMSEETATFWNAKDFTEDNKNFKCFGGLSINVREGKNGKNPTTYYGRDNVPIVCLNEKILEEVPHNHTFIWTTEGKSKSSFLPPRDGQYMENKSSVYEHNDGNYNLAYFTDNYKNYPGKKMYKIKDNALMDIIDTDINSSKSLVNNSKAVGFQVQKYNRRRSEGLFDLLDLVIESDIESYQTNIKLNIKHSGLNEVNSYLILQYDISNKNTVGCLKINENDNSKTTLSLTECNPNNNGQLWEIEFLEQSTELCLIKSKENSKYLLTKTPGNYKMSSKIVGDKEISNVNLKPFIWKIISS